MPSSSTDTFARAWRGWDGTGSAASEARLAELLAFYEEPHRHYHGTSHIADLLERAKSRRFADPRRVTAAIFYHDAIYAVGASDNEARSAALAVQNLRTLGWSTAEATRVAAMIRATARHSRTGDPDTDRFLDLDLAILADPPERYAVYRQSIMDEYRTRYSHGDYRRGRVRLFIEPTLAGSPIFVSGTFPDMEARARANLVAERDWLLGD